MIKKILSNSAIYGIAPYIPRIVSVFILPILTKHLTDTDYGIAGTISAYLMALTAFSTLGVSAILQVTFFKSPYQYKILWREIYGFLQFWMIVFAVIQAVLLYFIIPQEAIENRWAIIFLSNFNTVFFGPSSFLAPLFYQLSQRPLPIAIRSVVSGLLTIIINYILIVVYNYGYMGWYIGGFLGGFLVNTTYWYSLNIKIGITPIYKFKKRTILNTLKLSMPMIPHYYSVFMINNFNRIVMDQTKVPIGKIGEYNIAQNVSSIIETGVLALEKAISPMCMAEIKKNNEIELKKIINVFILITFCCTFIFSLWCKEIFELLIKNDTLLKAYPIASLLVLALNYRPLYIAATNVYFYNMKTKDLLYITLIAGVISIIGNIILIPLLGILGGAIITYIAYLYQGYIGFFLKPFKEYSNISFPVFKLFALQNIITIIAMLNLNSSYMIKCTLTFCTFICILLYLVYDKKLRLIINFL